MINDGPTPVRVVLSLLLTLKSSEYGARVALVDGVTPSPHGTTWGIGGTCANVGCIPKKLMHHAGIVGKEVNHAEKYGWTNVEKGEHSWLVNEYWVEDQLWTVFYKH
ncbi:hypothetical protein ANCDUO_04759 [Ancylostoma duodenale]|uniref:FAD/NAD(P)-binding domain-containing protein n=1 Tax=Ancylostoma duodenale TaxID=51022 RepID=A0A0C2DQG5_9BILA|nr:hypothetical protein ANCDUO_04759 [Ancylostoma duodenale]